MEVQRYAWVSQKSREVKVQHQVVSLSTMLQVKAQKVGPKKVLKGYSTYFRTS